MKQQAAARIMSPTPWARTLEEIVIVAEPPPNVFAWVDDPRHTGMHMSRPSMAMLGGRLRVERLSPAATGAGTTYRSWGRVLGLPIDFTTTVTAWVANQEKKWRTIGEPRLIVLGDFEMQFALTPVGRGTRLRLAIRYELPSGRLGHLLGALLAAPYARWCLRRMARDATAALGTVA